MANDLSNALSDSPLLYVFDQWWCPICSDASNSDFICELCQQLIMESDATTVKTEPSETVALFSQYMLNTRNNPEQNETVLHSKSSSEHKHMALINSEAPVVPSLAVAASPPHPQAHMSLTVRDRRHMHESGAQIIFDNIVKYCRQKKINFVDDQFPPSAVSVGVGSFQQVVQWLRISEAAPSSAEEHTLPWTVYSSPQPSDIAQGALGNCWLVAALALVSEKPRLLAHILLTKTVNTVGAYLVRICHNGLWKTIIVDDFFPCTRHKHLVFTQAKRRQLYVPLIEKACAKLFRSYAALRSGNMREGLQLLTGASCDYIDLQPTQTALDSDFIWAKLLSACKSELLVGASSGGTRASSADYDRAHIHQNHAFSLLAAHAIDGTSSRFVLVRDPHSHSNYREASITENILRKLRLVNPATRSTGAFWISWNIFLHYFSSITISHYDSKLYDIREKGRFTSSSIQYVTVYYFHVPQPSSINISLIYHRLDRTTHTSHTQSFVVCDADDFEQSGIIGAHESILMSKCGGYTYWTGFLKAGRYVLVPFSTSFWHNNKKTRNFTVVIHSSVQLSLIIQTRPATFLADCIISAVIKNAKKKQEKNANFYTTSANTGLKLFVVENTSIEDYLRLNITLQNSKNVLHSRHTGSPHGTQDCIPLRHRQIVFAMEWVDKAGESASMSYSQSYRHEKQKTSSVPPIDISAKDFHSPRGF